jgi:hypothetical protein
MLVEHLLRDRVIFGKRLIVPMPMPAAISAGFRLERQRHLLDRSPKPRQHIREHGIVFELQIIDAHFDRCMPVTEVISGACERQHIGRTNQQHSFRGRGNTHEAAVVGNEHIAVAQHGAAWQHKRDFLARIEGRGKATLAARLERQRQTRCARNQHARDLHMRIKTFVDRSHTRQKRKYRCAIGSTFAGSQVSSSPFAIT